MAAAGCMRHHFGRSTGNDGADSGFEIVWRDMVGIESVGYVGKDAMDTRLVRHGTGQVLLAFERMV